MNNKHQADDQQVIDRAVAQAVSTYAEVFEEKMQAAIAETFKRGAEYGRRKAE